MARKNNSTETQQKERPKGLVSCMNCMHSLLHRYGNNPILAACQQQPQPYDVRFPYQVEVASCLRKCELWSLCVGEKVIEQRQRRAA